LDEGLWDKDMDLKGIIDCYGFSGMITQGDALR
jgi:hypothetical protein